MQAFDELWWDHDQVVAWADTRRPEAVEYAAFGRGGLRLPPSTQKIADWIRETVSRMGPGILTLSFGLRANGLRS